MGATHQSDRWVILCMSVYAFGFAKMLIAVSTGGFLPMLALRTTDGSRQLVCGDTASDTHGEWLRMTGNK